MRYLADKVLLRAGPPAFRAIRLGIVVDFSVFWVLVKLELSGGIRLE